MTSVDSLKRRLASYFSIGDLITYGKYLNKKGRIVGFTTDEKGYPAVEIEPVPKDNKKNKTLTLFKIRKVPLEKQAMTSAKTSAKCLVSRYRSAFGGWIVVVGKIRIQRWNSAIKVWDLTNAGKRGKKVDGLSIWTERNLPFIYERAFIGRLYERLQDASTLAQAKASIEDYMEQYPDALGLKEFQEKGVDVQPEGATSLRLTTSTGCKIEATPLEWSVVHSADIKGPKGSFKQDRIYASEGKISAQRFYNWLLANTDKISKMTIQDFQKLWNDLKIKYHSH